MNQILAYVFFFRPRRPSDAIDGLDSIDGLDGRMQISYYGMHYERLSASSLRFRAARRESQ